jgi:hypothetical protein
MSEQNCKQLALISYLPGETMTPSAVAMERCGICGCALHRTANTYARPSREGRSHATRHHYVAERFFGRSANRRGTIRDAVFHACPWQSEGNTGVFCYECHEELLHNPVLLAEDIDRLRTLVRSRKLSESTKPAGRTKLAGRIQLMHEVIAAGLVALTKI